MKRDVHSFIQYNQLSDNGIHIVYPGRIARLRYGHPQGGRGCYSMWRGNQTRAPRVQDLHEFFDTIERTAVIIRHNTRCHGKLDYDVTLTKKQQKDLPN